MGLDLITFGVALVVSIRREVRGGTWCLWEAPAPSTVQLDECQGLRL